MSTDKDTLALGLVQMTSAATHDANIATVARLAREAARQGCEMIALPEVAGLMNRRASQTTGELTDAARDPFLAACKTIAKENGLWIHVGSTPVTGGSEGRLLNHAELIDPDGQIVASYDKIHLFDVKLDGRKPILESSRFASGEEAISAQTPWGPLGLTICYDLRFPGLYRMLAQSGARVLFVPSAFLVPTGHAHWEILLRARAIENGAFVVAAAQVGRHEDGRETYGHSMIVDPWGKVLADMGAETGLLRIDLDLALVDARRAEIPSLKHDRPY